MRKQCLRAFSAVLCCMALLFGMLPRVYAAETVGVIVGSAVNVRNAASTDGARVARVTVGEAVTVLETVTGQEAESGCGTTWYYIKNQSGVAGYVYGKYVVLQSTETFSDDFNQQLAAFPESYRAALCALHTYYPNWRFVADNLSVSFAEAVAQETVFPRKLVPASAADSLKSMVNGAYNWDTGVYNQTSGAWVGASEELIAYCMDPRNFLDIDNVYIFARQTCTGTETAEILTEHGIKNTFLNNTIPGTDPPCTYADAIMTAAAQSGVSPYVLASTILQEQGNNGSSMISGSYPGYEGYYNFFNIGATGSTQSEVLRNGMERARSEGWDTPLKSIVGGAAFYAQKYISVGQDTYYYKNFNVKLGDYNHQYAQNVYDSTNSAKKLRGYYISESQAVLTFVIPVFADMPATAVAKPAETGQKNNYYFNCLSGGNLSPQFSRYNQNYTLSVEGDTTLAYEVPTGAAYVGAAVFSLAAGQNTVPLTVRSESGVDRNYYIQVTASVACTLYIGGTASPVTQQETADAESAAAAATVLAGDVNGDGRISVADLGAVKFHLLGKTTLTDTKFTAGDVNGDGKISVADLGKIKFHLLGKISLTS